MKGVIVVCALLAAAACSKNDTKVEIPSVPQSHYANAPAPGPKVAVLITPSPEPVINEIKLERKGCNGACAEYTLDLRKDDTALYMGSRHAIRKGAFFGNYDFARFISWIKTEDAFGLDERYGETWIDAERLTLTIVRSDRTKKIDVGNTAQMPPKLYGIVLAMEGAAGSVRWHKAAAPKSK